MFRFSRMIYFLMFLGFYVDFVYAVDSKPPVISNFTAEAGSGDIWTFSGTVYDPDDDVEGLPVVFGGVLESYYLMTYVEADGSFSITVELPDLQSGVANAQACDWSYTLSNAATCYVFAD